MKLLKQAKDFLAKYFAPEVKKGRRAYAAAQQNRLTFDWNAFQTSSDVELKNNLRVVRDRSRALERDNDYFRNYLKMVETNVVGANGIALQMRLENADGTPDLTANKIIEAAWELWGYPENCTVAKKMSWVDVQDLVMRSTARDGAVLIRKVVGYDNDFGFALQILECDHLDEQYNVDNLGNGNYVKMSVEFDKWGKAIAYYMLTKNPGDLQWSSVYEGKYRVRIPADEIIHAFLVERPSQNREIPWVPSGMMRLRMIEGYELAALVAARQGACKSGFFRNPDPEGVIPGEQTEHGKIMEAEPGMFQEIGNSEFVSYDPTYPHDVYDPFMKRALQGVAAGLPGASYHNLACDLEGVNYSSMRAGTIEEREVWKKIQLWAVCSIVRPIFKEVIKYAILSGKLKMPMSRYNEIIESARFQGRRWPWVDPKNDIEANVLAIKNGVSSRKRVCSELGVDLDEIIEDTKSENAELSASNLAIAPDAGKYAIESDPDAPKAVLAEKLGVGGTQSLIQVLTAAGKGEITYDSAVATLFSVFGIAEDEAKKMVPKPDEKKEEPIEQEEILDPTEPIDDAKKNGHNGKSVSRLRHA